MKKPLPVKIVEALGWTYVALSVLGLFCALVGVASASMEATGSDMVTTVNYHSSGSL